MKILGVNKCDYFYPFDNELIFNINYSLLAGFSLLIRSGINFQF